MKLRTFLFSTIETLQIGNGLVVYLCEWTVNNNKATLIKSIKTHDLKEVNKKSIIHLLVNDENLINKNKIAFKQLIKHLRLSEILFYESQESTSFYRIDTFKKIQKELSNATIDIQQVHLFIEKETHKTLDTFEFVPSTLNKHEIISKNILINLIENNIKWSFFKLIDWRKKVKNNTQILTQMNEVYWRDFIVKRSLKKGVKILTICLLPYLLFLYWTSNRLNKDTLGKEKITNYSKRLQLEINILEDHIKAHKNKIRLTENYSQTNIAEYIDSIALIKPNDIFTKKINYESFYEINSDSIKNLTKYIEMEGGIKKLDSFTSWIQSINKKKFILKTDIETLQAEKEHNKYRIKLFIK